jgi:uncharacterized membrane protein
MKIKRLAILLIGFPVLLSCLFFIIAVADNNSISILGSAIGYLVLGGSMLLASYKIIPDTTNFWATTEHELLHAIVATFIYFRKPVGMASSPGRGVFIHSASSKSKSESLIITLAPYIIYPGILIPLILYPVVADELAKHVLIFILGFSTTHYAVRLYKEARPWQSDIEKSGYLTAYTAISTSIVATLALILYVVGEPSDVVFQQAQAKLIALPDNVLLAVEWVKQTIQAAL